MPRIGVHPSVRLTIGFKAVHTHECTGGVSAYCVACWWVLVASAYGVVTVACWQMCAVCAAGRHGTVQDWVKMHACPLSG